MQEQDPLFLAEAILGFPKEYSESAFVQQREIFLKAYSWGHLLFQLINSYRDLADNSKKKEGQSICK